LADQSEKFPCATRIFGVAVDVCELAVPPLGSGVVLQAEIPDCVKL